MSTNRSLLDSVSISRTKKGFQSFITALIFVSKEKNIVVIEGPFDREILSNFLDKDATIIKPCDGIGYIEKVFDALPPVYTNVIGVVDSDYSFGVSKHNRVFCYDYCNIEMMIFHDNQLFDSLQIESNGINIEKKVAIDKRNETLNKLKPLSIFRLTNAKFFATKTIIGKDDVFPLTSSCVSIPIDAIKQEIIDKINGCTKEGINQSFKTSFISNYNNEYSKNYDTYDITNGHDFMELFCAYFNIDERELRRKLKSAFTIDLFKKTKLFKKINNYQTIQSTKILM